MNQYAFVGAGSGNSINADYGVIGGGYNNQIAGGYSVVGGGQQNSISNSAQSAVISGGENNKIGASGTYAMIPGGDNNLASGTDAFAAGHYAKSTNSGAFVWADRSGLDFSSYGQNTFSVRAAGGTRFYSGAATGVELTSGSGGWSSLSDRNAKENVRPVDARELLEKLAALPLGTWNYKEQPPSIRHVGPMAQDFHEAFGVGEDERHINTVDADGVALAAIQGLNQKLEEQWRRQSVLLKEKEKELQQLRESVNELKALVQKLAGPTN